MCVCLGGGGGVGFFFGGGGGGGGHPFVTVFSMTGLFYRRSPKG